MGTCYLLLTICYLLSITCYLLLAICYLLSVTCYLLLAICYLLSVTCYLLLAICYLLSVTRKLVITCKRLSPLAPVVYLVFFIEINYFAYHRNSHHNSSSLC